MPSTTAGDAFQSGTCHAKTAELMLMMNQKKLQKQKHDQKLWKKLVGGFNPSEKY